MSSLITTHRLPALLLAGLATLTSLAAAAQSVSASAQALTGELRPAGANTRLPAHAIPGSATEGSFQAAALGRPSLQLRLDGRVVVANRKEELKSNGGHHTWIGDIEGAPGSTLSVTTGAQGSVYGLLRLGLDVYEITSTAPGRVLVYRIDEDRLPQEHAPIRGDAAATTSTTTPGYVAEATAAEPVVQDILVVYTPAAAAARGGTAQIQTLIQWAIDSANSAYLASQVNTRLNLVGMQQVDYVEPGNDMGLSLSRLAGTTDGFMDNVHALRDSLGADLVALLAQDTNYCGIAYLPGQFSVTLPSCISGYTFSHEVGHNQGAHHDKPTTGSTSTTAYNFGYRTCDHPDRAAGQVFRTVLAYSCASTPRVNYFSNPNILYNDVAAMGIATTEDPTKAADNARVLNERATITAGYRTAAVTLPAAPGNLAATSVASTQVNLAWTDNAADESGYRVERSTAGAAFTQVAQLAANASTYAASGLTAGTTYAFRVRAYNGAGNSAWSNTVSVTTPVAAVPAAPSNLSASNVLFDRATLTWTDNSADETGFTVQRTSNGGSTWSDVGSVGAGVVSLTSTGLTASTAYGFRVRANNSAGSSAYSNVVNVTTPAAPAPPVAPSPASVAISGQTVTVNWANVANETGYELVRDTYNAKRKSWSSTVTSIAADVGSASVTLSAGTYRYRVRALGTAGNSTYANALCTGATGCGADGWAFTISGGGGGGKPRR